MLTLQEFSLYEKIRQSISGTNILSAAGSCAQASFFYLIATAPLTTLAYCAVCFHSQRRSFSDGPMLDAYFSTIFYGLQILYLLFNLVFTALFGRVTSDLI
jgi:hypothetical protein